jgi:hypothetical protein
MHLFHKWKKWFYDSYDAARGFYRYCTKCGKEQVLCMSWGGHQWQDMTEEDHRHLNQSLEEAEYEKIRKAY